MFGEKILGLIHLYCTDPHQGAGCRRPGVRGGGRQAAGHRRRTSSGGRRRCRRKTSRSASSSRSRASWSATSPAIKAVEHQIGRVAGTNATVLIRGESGVGKELVARAIHYSSAPPRGAVRLPQLRRADRDAAGKRAVRPRKGLVHRGHRKEDRQVRGGRPRHHLPRRNRRDERRHAGQAAAHPGGPSFERVGGNTPIRVDVRVVSATNSRWRRTCRTGTFRRDLFFRLQVVEIRCRRCATGSATCRCWPIIS